MRHGPALYDCSISFDDTGPAAGDCSREGSPDSSSGLPGFTVRSSPVLDQHAHIVSWHVPSCRLASGVDALEPAQGSESRSRTETGYADSSCVEDALDQPFNVHAISARRWTDLQLQTCSTAVVQLAGQDQGLAPGQFAVFYQNSICVGSGIIAEAL